MDKWLIEVTGQGYYTGNTYIFEGCLYPAFDRYADNAKEYTSYKRALNGIKALQRKTGECNYDVTRKSEARFDKKKEG